MRRFRASWRAGLLLAIFGSLCLIPAVLSGGLVGALCLATAWLTGWAFRGAYASYRRLLELDQQIEQSRFYRAQLDALQLELASPDPDARAAAERRLLELDPFYSGGIH